MLEGRMLFNTERKRYSVMPECFVCKRPVGQDALSPKEGKMWFHPSCLKVEERSAPSRRNKRRKMVGVSFVANGVEYHGASELTSPGRLNLATELALSSACKKTVAHTSRTPKGGNGGRRPRKWGKPQTRAKV